jgi:hypothetical protein
MSGEIPAAAPDPWLELRADWEAHEEKQLKVAVNDPMIQTFAGVLPFCIGVITPSLVIDSMEGYMASHYPDLPEDRRIEAFMGAADIFIKQEMNLNGEA